MVWCVYMMCMVCVRVVHGVCVFVDNLQDALLLFLFRSPHPLHNNPYLISGTQHRCPTKSWVLGDKVRSSSWSCGTVKSWTDWLPRPGRGPRGRGGMSLWAEVWGGRRTQPWGTRDPAPCPCGLSMRPRLPHPTPGGTGGHGWPVRPQLHEFTFKQTRHSPDFPGSRHRPVHQGPCMFVQGTVGVF